MLRQKLASDMEINTHEPGVKHTRMVSGFIQRVKGAKMVLSTCWEDGKYNRYMTL